jgi:FtsZ-binding cell division protein ZapB
MEQSTKIAPERDEIETLGDLEERIRRAAELVAGLRAERSELVQQRDAANAARERAEREAADAKASASKLIAEIDQLRSERKQVRARVEKLLGQMDLINAG